jgi:hypothetical protein
LYVREYAQTWNAPKDEIRTVNLASGQGDNDGSRVGLGDLPDNGRPAGEGRPLEAKEEEHVSHPKRSLEVRLPN